MTDTPHTPSPSLAGVRVRGRHKSPAPSPQSSPVRDCVAIRKIVFPFFCHFERSEKSLFRPEGEICLRSLAFARDDNPKLRHSLQRGDTVGVLDSLNSAGIFIIIEAHL